MLRGSEVRSKQIDVSGAVANGSEGLRDLGQTSLAEVADILDEYVSRQHLSDNAEQLPPESAASAFDPSALPCPANVLTGESSGNDVNESSPGFPVEGADVVPDGELVEHSVPLSL